MKVFYYDDPDFRIPAKTGDYHDESTRRFWGHMVTNRATRSVDYYAYLFSPSGDRANRLTKATFERLCMSTKIEHIQVEKMSERELNNFIDKISSMTKFQAERLLRVLVSESPYMEFLDERVRRSRRACEYYSIAVEK